MSKEEIIKTARGLGFILKHDNWETRNHECLHFNHPLARKKDNLIMGVIIEKRHVDEQILGLFADKLLDLGQYKMKQTS